MTGASPGERLPAEATLRPARAADLPGVVRLLSDSDLPVAGLPDDLSGFVVAENAEGLIGVAGLELYGYAALLRSVVVSRAARGLGLGAALVGRALTGSAVRRVTDVYLLTTTAESYFPRLGFAHISRDAVPPAVQASVEFRGACPASAAVMHRRLSRVLFLCTGNSARSQMAEAVLNRKGAGRFVAASAGTQPAPRVNPFAVEALEKYGFPWAGHPPRELEGLDRERWDFVITVCDRAREACPIFPGQPIVAHWSMADPAGVDGTADQKRRAFDGALRLIMRRIDLFVSLPADTLGRLALGQRVRAIGAVSAEADGLADSTP